MRCPTLAVPFFLTTFGVAMAGCATEPTEAPASAVRQAIINGIDSTNAQDAVVLIRVEGGNVPGGVCTGALVAPNLVLTARHCVSAGSDKGFACTQDGVAPSDAAASKPGADYPATSFKIFTGPKAPADDAAPRAVGKKVIHDKADTLCNHDIALILLEQALTDAPLAKMRLTAPATVGAKLTAVGWGVTTTEQQPAVRKQRTGIAITRVGPAEALPNAEFEVGEAICSGDSGGPALLEPSGEIIGVVSRGGNDKDNDPANPAKGCVNGTNIYTGLPAFKAMIDGAMAEASGSPSAPPPTAPAPAAAPDATSGCAVAGGTTNAHVPGVWLAGLATVLAAILRRRRRRA